MRRGTEAHRVGRQRDPGKRALAEIKRAKLEEKRVKEEQKRIEAEKRSAAAATNTVSKTQKRKEKETRRQAIRLILEREAALRRRRCVAYSVREERELAALRVAKEDERYGAFEWGKH